MQALPESLDSGFRQAFERARLTGQLERRKAAAMDAVSLEQLCASRQTDGTVHGCKAREIKHIGTLKAAMDEAIQIATQDAPTHAVMETLTDPKNKHLTAEALEDKRKHMIGLRLKASLMRDKVNLNMAKPYRIITAYRICKELARIKGESSVDETLAECLEPTKQITDPWMVPTGIRGTIEEVHRTRKVISVSVIKKIEVMQKFFRIASIDYQGNLHTRAGGMSYMPPTAALKVRVEKRFENKVAEFAAMHYGMDQLDHFKLYTTIWHEVMNNIAESLYLQRGSKELPELGEFGLIGLIDPDFSGSLWPLRHELIQFEELLLQEMRYTYLQDGEAETKRILKDKYGFLHHEERDLMNLMLYKIKEHVIDDIDVSRAQTLLQLESLIDRTKDSGDTRAELAAIKLKSGVLGLFKDTGRESMDDFIDAMVEVSKERDIEEGYVGAEISE